ncbi:hypothetical protein SUDANB106_00814 [Streptomyces sp. enrichment culture]
MLCASGFPCKFPGLGPLAGNTVGAGMEVQAYTKWQEVLQQEFFGPDAAGHPVVLYVSDDVAEELRKRHGLDCDLTGAVHAVLALGTSRPYAAVEQLLHKPLPSNEPPPVLPLLACSVIAATRMASDGVFRRTNYHSRFSELLTGDTSLLKRDHYSPVARMWQRLASWQHSWGTAKGLCTIPSPEDLPPNQTRIGFAISQAVVCEADRQLLPQLFVFLRRKSASWPPSGQAIADAAEFWDHSSRFSAGFRHALVDQEFRPFAEKVLARLASAWDGSLDGGSDRTPRGELLLRFQARQFGWIARLHQDGEPSYELQDGVSLERIPHTRYYRVIGLQNPTGGSLLQDTRLASARLSLHRPASPVLVLRQDDELDCMTSTDSIEPGEEHIILAAPHARQDVERLITLAQASREADAGRLAWVPDGWSVHRKVVFDDTLKLKQAISHTGGTVQGLQPSPQHHVRLTGGLLLAPELSRRLYLRGAEPSVLLPDGASGEVVLDGTLLKPPFPVRGVPVPLWPSQLPSGKHILEAEGAAESFSTAEEAPTSQEPDFSCGFPVSGQETAAVYAACQEQSNGPVLRGAGTDSLGISAVPGIVLAQRGADTTLFLACDGRVWNVEEPDTPHWWERLKPKPSAYYFEVALQVSGGWLLQQRNGKWAARSASPPPPRLSPGRDHTTWVSCVLGAASASRDPRWDEYVAVAREARGE